MRLTTLFGLLLCVSPLVVNGQETQSLTIKGYPSSKTVALSLDEAIKRALERNINLELQRFNPAILNYDIRSAYGAYYDPVLGGAVSRNHSAQEGGGFNEITGAALPPSLNENETISSDLSGALPTGMRYQLFNDIAHNENRSPFVDTNLLTRTSITDTWSSRAGISVTQPLLRDFWTDSGRTAIKLRKQDKKISELDLETLAHSTVRDVVNAYYSLVGALESVKVAEADLKVRQQNSDETRRKVQVGTMAELDAKKAQSEIALSRISLTDALDAVGDAESELKGLVTDDFVNQLGVRIVPTDKLLVVPLVIDMPTVLKTAFERRPDLQAQRDLLERQKIQVKFTFNQLFPRLDLAASWGVAGLDERLPEALADLAYDRYENDSVGAIFSMPLTMTRERNQHKAAKLVKAQQLLRVKAQEEVVIKEVDDAIRGVNTALERVRLSRDAVVFAEADLDAQQRKFTAGTATSFDVMEATSNLTRARVSEIRAIVDYNISLNELARAEGTILLDRRIDFDAVHRLPVAP